MYLFADGKNVGKAIQKAILEDLEKGSSLSELITQSVLYIRKELEKEKIRVIIAGGDDILCVLDLKDIHKACRIINKAWSITGLKIDIAWGLTLEETFLNLTKVKNNESRSC